jgi:hypothetical protein
LSHGEDIGIASAFCKISIGWFSANENFCLKANLKIKFTNAENLV